MTLCWLLLPSSSLPDDDEWLGPNEIDVLAGLTFPKRRAEWRLGRFTAKRALASFHEVDDLGRIQITAAEDGAPEAFIDGRPAGSPISISHREGAAACVIVPDGRVGCDLEAVEARTPRFVRDFFTDRERTSIAGTSAALHDRHVALTWSAKESALKALRVGLRRDTRSVEAEIRASETAESGWHPLRASISPEGLRFDGWWRQEAAIVLTIVSDRRFPRTPSRLTKTR